MRLVWLGGEGSNLDFRDQNPASYRLDDTPLLNAEPIEWLRRKGSNLDLQVQGLLSYQFDDAATIGHKKTPAILGIAGVLSIKNLILSS